MGKDDEFGYEHTDVEIPDKSIRVMSRRIGIYKFRQEVHLRVNQYVYGY